MTLAVLLACRRVVTAAAAACSLEAAAHFELLGVLLLVAFVAAADAPGDSHVL